MELEKLSGIVERVTYHNPTNGWSVIKVRSFNHKDLVPVILYQTQVFAGATMEFFGNWQLNNKFGRQFKAEKSIEQKPATTNALEKYLGSGLIKGIGPKTAKKIVHHFKHDTLNIFENNINKLLEVRGVAHHTLQKITVAWDEHKEIRNIMLYLQEHGISTLFAVKIYQKYRDQAIQKVSEDPYQLARDFYGIGFISADRIAATLDIKGDNPKRIKAGIRHVLVNSREEGHCYLKIEQIIVMTNKLLEINSSSKITECLAEMETTNELKIRVLDLDKKTKCYYHNTIFFNEYSVVKKVKELLATTVLTDKNRIDDWMKRYSNKSGLILSSEQEDAVKLIINSPLSILTGGPGCGKTTTTKTIVHLAVAMGKSVLLAAPTGRAAQRMGEVIGYEAKTIHRLLIWNPATGGFQKGEDDPLVCDFLVIDESSMLDITLASSLFKAIPSSTQVLLIGDVDQLPAVGPGNVLNDLIASEKIPFVHLSKIFRQASGSNIIKYAHEINNGTIPKIESPLINPNLWTSSDTLFIDAEEATKEQLSFISKVKHFYSASNDDLYGENISSKDEIEFSIPKKFQHVDLEKLIKTDSLISELKLVLKKIHPWSSLHYNKTALQMLEKVYLQSIPKYLGKKEIQILTPMIRGSLGASNLNRLIQEKLNPLGEYGEFKIGDKTFRIKDRIIQKVNNYNLGVFNGDIGEVTNINHENASLIAKFSDNRIVTYTKDDISQLDLAYAITIHKSQGSEFDVVIIPIMSQHFKMLFRNLIYTGLTRAKKMAIFIGTRKALGLAIRTNDAKIRQTSLKHLLQKD